MNVQPRPHAGSTPIGGINGTKGICRCGLEIGDKLKSVLNKTIQYLDEDRGRARSICDGRWNAENGWDIKELAWEKKKFQYKARACGAEKCVDTASVYGKCYKTHDVNYVLWGALARYCGLRLNDAAAIVQLYRRSRPAIGIVYGVPEMVTDPVEEDVRLYWTYMGVKGLLEYKEIWHSTWACGLVQIREQAPSE